MSFSWLIHCDVSLIPVEQNAPVVFFDFSSKDLDISNDPDLLKCFLILPLPNFKENNPVDLMWIQMQHIIGTELVIKAAKYLEQYFNKVIDVCAIICHAFHNKYCLTQWKIALTKGRVVPLI